MISCPTCGVVLDEDVAPVQLAKFKGEVQESIYCPVCRKLAARRIGGKDVKVTSGKKLPEATIVPDTDTDEE